MRLETPQALISRLQDREERAGTHSILKVLFIVPVYSKCPRALIELSFAPERVKGMSALAGEEDPRVLTAPGELCPPPKPFLAPALDAGHSQEARDSTTVKGEDG